MTSLATSTFPQNVNGPVLGNVFVTSIPKAGTHLLSTILAIALRRQALPLHKNQTSAVASINELTQNFGVRTFLLQGHHRFHHARHLLSGRWKIFVLIRDPRDILLSMRDFLASSSTPVHAEAYKLLAPASLEDQIKLIVEGIVIDGFEIAPLRKFCSGFIEWTKVGALCVRYEDLLAVRSETADAIAERLQIPATVVVDAIHQALAQDSRTKRTAQSERWRREMSPELLAFIRQKDGGIVERLGYRWDAPAGS